MERQPDEDEPGDHAPEDQELQGALRAAFRPRLVSRPEPSSAEHDTANPDRYDVLGELGRGGMGIVLHARDRDFGRDLAIKILRRRFRGRRQMEQRFVTEAQICGQLQHPGIVPVHEVGWQEDQRPFFTMKLVRGSTLAALLDERESPDADLPRYLAIFLQVCQAMSYAHSRGVVHRDLKPDNIMVGAFGEVQIMDWGVARVVREATNAIPVGERPVETVLSDARDSTFESGSVLGTWAYMPPEQARGDLDAIDERSDVFSLGAILCEILTGCPPYDASTPEALREDATAANLDGARIRLARCGADAELVEMAAQALSPEHGERQHSAAVLADEVEAHLSSVEERLRSAELARAAAEARATAEGRARRLTIALAATVLFVALAGGVTWVVLDQQRRTRLREIERVVNLAIGEARRHEGEALAAAVGDLSGWKLGIQSLQRAAVVASGGADEAMHAEVATMLQRFTRSLETARKDAEVIDLLSNIRESLLPTADYDYAAAFSEYGIDVDVLPVADAAAAIDKRAIRTQLTGFLDSWARTRRTTRNKKSADWKRLVDVAMLVDEDEARRRVRTAVRERDRPALLSLATEITAKGVPVNNLVLLGEALAATGEHRAAVALLTKFHLQFPRHFRLNQALAYSLEKLSPPRWSGAVRHRGMAALARPDLVAPRVDYSIALRQTGDAEAAQAWLDSALAIDKEAGYAHLLRRLVDDLNDVDAGAKVSEKALDELPKSWQIWHDRGATLIRLGQTDRAAAAYRQAIKLGAHSITYHNLGLSLEALGKPDDAITNYREGIGMNPNNYDLHYRLGVVLTQQGKLKEAVPALRKSVDLNPVEAEFQRYLGLAFEKSGEFEQALKQYQEAIRIGASEGESFLADCHNGIGVVHYRKHAYEKAAAKFREAMAIHPVRGVQFNLGNALKAMGRLDEARTWYQAELERDANFAPAHDGLGTISGLEHELDAAIRSGRKATDLAPTPNFLLNLAWTLCTARRFSEAEKCVDKVREANPGIVRTDSIHAYILQETGSFQEALEANREIAERYPDQPIAQRDAPVWIAESRRLLELDTRLASVLSGTAKPANAKETVEFAHVAAIKQLWAGAARLFASIHPTEAAVRAAGTAGAGHANELAGPTALALAGCGLGADRDSTDEATRTRWRELALAWLRAGFDVWRELADSEDPHQRRRVVPAMNMLKYAPGLRELREEKLLATLPAAEQESWRGFWRDVERLRERARGK